jgi:hypothetical protein
VVRETSQVVGGLVVVLPMCMPLLPNLLVVKAIWEVLNLLVKIQFHTQRRKLKSFVMMVHVRELNLQMNRRQVAKVHV